MLLDEANCVCGGGQTHTWRTTCLMPVLAPTENPTPSGSASAEPSRDQPNSTAGLPCAQAGLPAQSQDGASLHGCRQPGTAEDAQVKVRFRNRFKVRVRVGLGLRQDKLG